MDNIKRKILRKKQKEWKLERKEEFKTLNPSLSEFDSNGDINISFNSNFLEWLEETEAYQVDIETEDGVKTVTKIRKIRPMPSFTVSEEEIKECFGACLNEELPETYNDRKLQIIQKNTFENQNMVIIDKGRDIDEQVAILIENGVYRGYGYFNLNYQINNPEVLESIITPMEHNRDSQHIIQSFMRKNRRLKILKIET